MSRSIDICICTYRRAHIAETLASLARIERPEGFDLRVLVADNDTEESARRLVERSAAALPYPVTYFHAPAGNISIARNACLDASRADFVAFIDDDETVTPPWLRRLVDVAEQTGSDVVLGPVRATYAADAPSWMRAGDFHSTFPVVVGTSIQTGYTCNVLMRRDATAICGRRFDLARGKTGGEDTAFFAGVYRDGGTIEYAPDAWVEEEVPSGRATFNWLARRRFRVGQTHGRLQADSRGRSALLKDVAIAGAKVGFCVVTAALTAPIAHRRNRNILRGIMHAGVVSGRVGQSELELY